jgi:hypothetical protein
MNDGSHTFPVLWHPLLELDFHTRSAALGTEPLNFTGLLKSYRSITWPVKTYPHLFRESVGFQINFNLCGGNTGCSLQLPWQSRGSFVASSASLARSWRKASELSDPYRKTRNFDRFNKETKRPSSTAYTSTFESLNITTSCKLSSWSPNDCYDL